jgi:hypothetical protein
MYDYSLVIVYLNYIVYKYIFYAQKVNLDFLRKYINFLQLRTFNYFESLYIALYFQLLVLEHCFLYIIVKILHKKQKY